MDKLCIVTPIYSSKAFGGAERLVWEYAKLLSEDFLLDIVTTTARDYRTWKSSYESGIEENGNLRVLRFSVKGKRSFFFQRFHRKALKNIHNLSNIDFQKWLKMQGPYCPDLINYMEENINQYNKIIYFTYLYYPIVNSLPFSKEKSICVLTLHDEPMAYFPQFKELFTEEITYSFNVPEERDVFKRIYGFTPPNHSVIGMHLEPVIRVEPIERKKPYILYIGRMDIGKGIYDLIQLFEQWITYSGEMIELILIGGGKCPKIKHPQISYLGFVSEEEKAKLLEGTDFIVNPSPMESFSIVLMEAWLREKAVLVNAESDTMKNHCLRSNGGLYYSDKESFFKTMDYLVTNPGKRKIMGQNGKRYVEYNYSKEKIKQKLLNLIQGKG